MTKFTAKAFAAATAAMIDASGKVDQLEESQIKLVNKWASVSAAGIISGAITLETVKEAIIASKKGAVTVADCGSTVKGRYYAFATIIGKEAGQRLIDGESLNTVARELRAKTDTTSTGKGKRKGGNGKASKAKAFTLENVLEALNGWLDEAAKKPELARGLAKNEALAAAIAKVGGLSAIIAADDKKRAANAKAIAKREAAEKKAAIAAKAASRKAEAAKAAAAANVKPLPVGKAKATAKVAPTVNRPKAKLPAAKLRKVA